jgi:TIR domain/PBS lyase HEAT-like repeat
MSDIFLSYSHEDRERVRPVVAQLETQRWSIWWDRRVRPGQRWEELLRDELKNCRAVVVLWTKNSVRSMWVQLEASAGLEIDGLVPIQLDPFATAPIPSKFEHIQALREIISRPATSPTLAENTDLATSLSLGGDLGSTDPHDLQYIQGKVQQLGRKAVPALLAALQFPEPERRGHAAYLLGWTGDRTVVSSLAPLLADRTKVPLHITWMPTVRAAAALSLRKIGTTGALEALAEAFE